MLKTILTYGAIAGLILFLFYLYLTSIVIMLGAEFNAEMQRSQQLQAGHHAPLDKPFLEPRDTSKLEK